MSGSDYSNLLRAARDGSTAAMSALFERYGERLHALVRLRLGANLRRHLDSRDIVQVTLMKAFQGFDRFDGSESGALMGWLGRIAHDEICDQADYYKRKKRDMARDTTLHGKTGRIDALLRSETSRLRVKEQTERFERAFDKLSEAHREIVLLRSYEELTFPEIAKRLEKTPDACRMLYARAIASLTLEVRSLRRGD